MRGILIVGLSICAAAGNTAAARDLDFRLNQLEYESRIQRYDLDMVRRQQELDAVDEMQRKRNQAIIDRVGQTPSAPPPASPAVQPVVIVVAPKSAPSVPAFDLERDYVPPHDSPLGKQELMRNWPWAR